MGLWDSIKSVGGKIAGGIKSGVKAVGGIAAKAAPLVGMIPGVGTIGGGLIGSVGSLLSGGSLGDALKAGAMGATGGLIGGALGGGGGLIGKLGGALGGAGSALGKVGGALGGAVKGAGGLIGGLADRLGGAGNLAGLIGTGLGAVSAYGAHKEAGRDQERARQLTEQAVTPVAPGSIAAAAQQAFQSQIPLLDQQFGEQVDQLAKRTAAMGQTGSGMYSRNFTDLTDRARAQREGLLGNLVFGAQQSDVDRAFRGQIADRANALAGAQMYGANAGQLAAQLGQFGQAAVDPVSQLLQSIMAGRNPGMTGPVTTGDLILPANVA